MYVYWQDVVIAVAAKGNLCAFYCTTAFFFHTKKPARGRKGKMLPRTAEVDCTFVQAVHLYERQCRQDGLHRCLRANGVCRKLPIPWISDQINRHPTAASKGNKTLL